MSDTHRKLTTIFCADVQDYTRLMRADEEGTLARLKSSQDAMGRLIRARGGRVVNTWGDGLIAEFPSVVEAVRTAVDAQNELAGYNEGRPGDDRMYFRIGINLGDVIADGDDIYGDGVNVAARLQASAEPGGIVISNAVYDQVRHKMAVSFAFLGELEVKNIEGGVASYAVVIGASQEELVERSQKASGLSSESVFTAPKPDFGSKALRGSRLRIVAVVCAGLVAINLLSWQGVFWSAWPVLVLMILWAFSWVRRRTQVDRVLATVAISAMSVVAINLLSWQGVFWAIWPLLGLAVFAGIHWIRTRPGNIGP